MTNPLLDPREIAQFSEIKPEHIEPAIAAILEKNTKQLNHLITNNNSSFSGLVGCLEDMDTELNNVWSIISHLHNVKNTEEFRKPYETALQNITQYQLELGQNNELYQLFLKLKDSAEYKTLSITEKKIIDDSLLDFHLSGITLQKAQKEKFLAVEQKLVQLCNKFENNLLDATDAWSYLIEDENELAGIPEFSKKQMFEKAQEKKQQGFLLTLDFPSYHSVISYADNRELRELLYKAYTTKASDVSARLEFDNSEIMNEILVHRTEKAKILGYANYAELSLAKKMAKSPEEVLNFLTLLADKSHHAAQKEFSVLSQFAKEQYNLSPVEAWDIAYLSEKLRQKCFEINDEILRPYFPEQKVLSGLFNIIKTLFSINIIATENHNKWHPQVQYFELFDEQQQKIGALYLDLYARHQKRSGAWMDSCRTRHRFQNKTLDLPVAYVICNFTPSDKPYGSLLTHEEVQTVFHEFGHALHHLLTKQDHVTVSGINGVPWDGVEFPSQFMENFCWHKETLQMISEHIETKKPLSDELWQKMFAAKNFQSAMMMVRQLEFSLFDFLIHFKTSNKSDFIQNTLNEVRQQVAVVPIPPYNRFQHSFSHIFAGGYAAGYYSYKWAEVLSADAFNKFNEHGILNTDLGLLYRDKVLAAGGSKDYMDIFIDFMGRPPKVDALLQQEGILEV